MIELNGLKYVLNQCCNIWEWFTSSKVGEYTRFYDKVVFHTYDGFYAAYYNNLNNGFYI